MWGRYLYELPCQWNYVVWQCREDTWLGVQNPRTQTGKNNCPGEKYNHTQNNLWHKWWICQVRKLTVCHYFMETHWRFTIKINWEKICLLRSSSFGKYWIAKFNILKRLWNIICIKLFSVLQETVSNDEGVCRWHLWEYKHSKKQNSGSSESNWEPDGRRGPVPLLQGSQHRKYHHAEVTICPAGRISMTSQTQLPHYM